MENNKKEMPLNMVIEISRDELGDVINKIIQEYHLPMFLLEGIVSELNNEIKMLSKKELEETKKSFFKEEKEDKE